MALLLPKFDRTALALGLLVAQAMASPAFDYFVHRADQNGLFVPDPGGPQPPKGQWMINAVFNTAFVRVSDVVADGLDSSMATVVYSRWTPVNSTGEYLYLQHGGGGQDGLIYATSNYTLVKILPHLITIDGVPDQVFDSFEGNEIRWDYSGAHPQRFYFVNGPRFYQYDLGSDTAWLVHDFSVEFPAAALVHNDVEGDSSADSRYWAFMVKADYTNGTFPMLAIIAYDKSTDRILGILDQERYRTNGGAYPVLPRPNMVEISPSGKRLITHLGRAWGETGVATNWTRYSGSIYSAPLPIPESVVSEVAETDTTTSYDILDDLPTGPGTCFFDSDNQLLYIWGSDSASPSAHRICWEYGIRPLDIGTVFDGPHAWNLDFTEPVKVSVDETHSGWAWSYDGRELFVSQNNQNDWIEAIDIQSGAVLQCLYQGDMGWGTGMHFARMPAQARGWVLMSTSSEEYVDWGDSQLLMLEMKDTADQPLVWRLGCTHNVHVDYFTEGFAAISPTADRFWWAAAWPGQTNIETYEMRLPANWWGELAGANFPPQFDTDRDGMNNGDELKAGTDPLDAGSVLRIVSAQLGAPGEFVLEWQSVSNRLYSVYCSTNLLQGFSALAEHLPATPPINQYTHSSDGAGAGYYRIRVE
jgi:hypothetical protein